MDYQSMSLIELKQAAKGRRIKQYYIMKRRDLIEVLSLIELPFTMKLEKMTIIELREEAKRRGIKGFWALNRENLAELLYPRNETAADKNQEDKSNTYEHNDPQEHDSE
jgi:hypothetical protein